MTTALDIARIASQAVYAAAPLVKVLASYFHAHGESPTAAGVAAAAADAAAEYARRRLAQAPSGAPDPRAVLAVRLRDVAQACEVLGEAQAADTLRRIASTLDGGGDEAPPTRAP